LIIGWNSNILVLSCENFKNLTLKEWPIMETREITKKEFKELMKEAVISALTERKDLLEDAVAEAILDMKLAFAIEEGDTGEYISEETILAKLTD
jgi:hypothetical protein